MEEQPEEILKICPNCSKLIKRGDSVCSYCGKQYLKPQYQELKGGMAQPVSSDKNIRAGAGKRPISIFLCFLLASAFLITLLSLNRAHLPLFAVIIYFPIFIIITFSLIFVNLRNNKNRTLGFLISTCVLIAILIVSSFGFSSAESKTIIAQVLHLNNTSTATTVETIDGNKSYEEIGVSGSTVYVYTDLKDLDDLRIIADKYKNELFKYKSKFQIFFFNNKANAEHALKSPSLNYEDLVVLIARYKFNRNTGIDEINYDIEEKAFEKAPTIKLEIYEGPLYSEDGAICYYRLKAVVTGLPVPTVKFSKDDSIGNLGKNNVQINLNINESYTLTATATNSIGKATDSISLIREEK